MEMFQFADLIAEYSVSFTIIEAGEGDYDEAGEWVEGEDSEKDLSGALIPLSAKVVYDSGGRYTQADRSLYINQELAYKSKIIYNGQKFSLEEKIPYGDYADFNVYILKAVSTFD